MNAPNANRSLGLHDTLLRHTQRGELWHTEKEGVRCVACGHRCFIPSGRDGICKVRSNICNELRVPWGYVAGLAVDPIEKKPFFHVMPGARALSFGMLGCDFHCAYCQNWFTSQSIRDPGAVAGFQRIEPQQICDAALEGQARVVTSTYNEPLITSEWSCAIFEKAHESGLKTSYVSNGNATVEVLEYLKPHLDFMKIDLKGFNDRRYRDLGGVLANVLASIQKVHEMGFWLEIVTLLVPGFNDGADEIRQLTQFIASVSRDIPWHVTAFHADYKMADKGRTSASSLCQAAELGKESGLHFVYAGNLPGQTANWENTYCPHCSADLVVRSGFKILKNLMASPQCPQCHENVPGIWV